MNEVSNVKERVARLLIEELKEWVESWWYISLVHASTNTFKGGVVIKAVGPTHAWVTLHGMNLVGKDYETQTTGPISPDVMERIPVSMRWRLLSRTEAENLGK